MLNLGNATLFCIVRESNITLDILSKRYLEYLNLKEQYIEYKSLNRLKILDVAEKALIDMSDDLRNGCEHIDDIVLSAFKKIDKIVKNENEVFKALIFSCKDIRDFNLIFKIIDEVNNEYKRD